MQMFLIFVLFFLMFMTGVVGLAIGLIIGWALGRNSRPQQATPAPVATVPAAEMPAPADTTAAAPAIAAAEAPPVAPAIAQPVVPALAQPSRQPQAWSVALAFAVMIGCCMCSLLLAMMARLR